MRHFKPGVIVHWNDYTLAIQDAVEEVYQSYGYHWVITAGRDGTHMPTSKHYLDQALDIGIRTVKADDLPNLMRDLQHALGPDYDVVLEKNHFHIEFDPN